jgi:hypothetical protein
MKAFIRKSILLVLLVSGLLVSANAQRVIKGTVYKEGKPFAGVNVEMHRSSDRVMTSFDGKFEVKGDDKSRWLRFTFLGDSKRVDIPEGVTVFDYYWDGVEPAAEESEVAGVSLKRHEELIAAADRDYMNNLSLYTEFFRQQDYKSALTPWRKLYDSYPKATLNIYLHGVTMYESFIESAVKLPEKNAMLDSLMKIYDRRIKYFEQEGFVLGRKGTSWLKYNLTLNEDLSNEELIDIYKKGYDMLDVSLKDQRAESDLAIVLLYMQTTRSLYSLQQLPKTAVVQNYELAISVLNQKEENNPEEEGLTEVRSIIETIFAASGAADCEALISIFSAQFNERNDDIDFIKNMLRRLSRAGCDGSDLFFAASERMYELEPSAEAAFNMARMFVKQGDNQRAKTYYGQAMEQETDQSLLEEYYYEYAMFIFAIEHNLQESRAYARRALVINPNNCKANMLIGDIYVAASRNFGNDNFDRATVFWLAVDYFNKARTGEDCLADATQRVNTYRNYFPNREDAFMSEIYEGQNYTVKGWINETTKVRF